MGCRPALEFRLSVFGIGVFGYRLLGFGFWVGFFGFRLLGLGFWFGFLGLGFWFGFLVLMRLLDDGVRGLSTEPGRRQDGASHSVARQALNPKPEAPSADLEPHTLHFRVSVQVYLVVE